MAAPRISHVFLTLVALLLLPVAVRATCVTTSCHPQVGQGRVVHSPVADRDCTSCHKPAAKRAHPGPGSMAPAAKGRALCLTCHDDPAKKQTHVHPPVADGCLDCHDPHASAHNRLLLKPVGPLCLDCHESVVVGKQVHGPVRAGNCATCHVPHASNNERLLVQSGNTVCFNCHGNIQKLVAESSSQHQPVANGRCWECHAPHATDYRPLLRAYYPEALYTPYREGHYALCYNCHDKNAMEYDRTSEATNFRNRDQNLHYLHVNRDDKGRTCKVCHGIHGADQPRLLRSHMHDFGKWDIPMRWVESDNGGTCYVGCHKPKSYDRVRRIVNK